MSKKKSQKILIPRGLVDPNEDTLIEVPRNYKEVPVVVASRSDRSVSISRSTRSIQPRRDEEDFDYVMYNQRPSSTQYPGARYQPVNYVQPASTIQPRSYAQSSQAVMNVQPSVSYAQPLVQSRQSSPYEPAKQCTNATTSRSAVSGRSVDGISFTNLNETEKAELQQVQDKLEAFQRARRQFLLEANQVATINKEIQTTPSTGLSTIPFTTQQPRSSTQVQTGNVNYGTYVPSSTRMRSRRVQVIENDSDDDDYNCICK